jgi:hypothetical protein
MKRNTIAVLTISAAIALLAAIAPLGVVAAEGPQPAVAPLTLHAEIVATSELSASEVQALNLALQDEYKALATYEQIMADFGAVRPFTNIARAEEQHIAALTALYVTYGLDVPERNVSDIPTFASLTEAYAAGVQAEIANVALYDELFSLVENEDVIGVFTNLRDASQLKHLPAFERAASRTTGTRGGRWTR